MTKRNRAPRVPVDLTIDAMKTQNRTRENILQTLNRLLAESEKDFRNLERATSATAQARIRRDLWQALRIAVRLVEELSPSIDLLDRCSDEMIVIARQMEHLQKRNSAKPRSAAERERSTKLAKQLRNLRSQMRATPEYLTRLTEILLHRRTLYLQSQLELAEFRQRKNAPGLDTDQTPQDRTP